MVKAKFQDYFPSKPNSWTYSCLHCRAHLARHEDLISKSFQGSQGRAYLFHQVVNVNYSEAKQRVFLTGIHSVADVYCACCNVMLGWRYERAFEASQRYKEGKVIVELAHLIKDNCWDAEWLVPSRIFSPGQSREISHPVALLSPPSRCISNSCPFGSEPVNSEQSASANSAVDLETKLNTMKNSSIVDCFSAIVTSSSTAYSQYDSSNQRIISPGPNSCCSSCCGHTPEQDMWPGLQELRSNCTDLNAGTAAQGSQTQADAHSACSSTVIPQSSSSDMSTCTFPIGNNMRVETRGRSTGRGSLLGLRIPFGASATAHNGTGTKYRVGLRRNFTRRASSSSPSRTLLLPLTSDDESDQSGVDAMQSVPSWCTDSHALCSTPETLTRRTRPQSTITERSFQNEL